MGRKTEESNINYLRAFFNFPKTYTRKDICNHFGYSRSTTLVEIFRRRGLVYNRQPELAHEPLLPRSYFLVSILDYSYVEFMSGAQILSESILCDYRATHILRDYINKKFLVMYRGDLYVVCDSLEFNVPFDIAAENPYNMCRIRQEMRDQGYLVSFSTNLNEICRMLDIPRDTSYVRRRICERLDIVYVPSNINRGRRLPKPVYTISVDRGVRRDFRSISEMSRNFSLDPKQVQSYIDNEVEFHFNRELYRVYYL